MGIRENLTRTFILAAISTACIVAAPLATSADEPTLREQAEASRVKAERKREETLRRILAHQRDDQLRVYLRGGQSMYVNGRQISGKTLRSVVAESGLQESIITFALDVHPDRVKEVQQLLQDAGIDKVELGSPLLTLKEVIAAKRAETARNTAETLTAIVTRQKGDQLHVYLRPASIHVNGKQISSKTLSTVISETGLKQAVISARQDVSVERIKAIETQLRSDGIEQVETAIAK